jgi:hypothetical protein
LNNNHSPQYLPSSNQSMNLNMVNFKSIKNNPQLSLNNEARFLPPKPQSPKIKCNQLNYINISSRPNEQRHFNPNT